MTDDIILMADYMDSKKINIDQTIPGGVIN